MGDLAASRAGDLSDPDQPDRHQERGGRGDPKRIYPVFRDEEELGAGSHLSERIYQALDVTKVIVVLCSPRVVESTYVAEEIRYFKKIGKADRVYAAVIDGEPGSRTIETGQCFPDPLQYEVDEAGQVLKDRPAEPLASDFRLPDGSQGWTSPQAYRAALTKEKGLSKKDRELRVAEYAERLRLAKLKLIAGILGVPLNTLNERDKAYELEQAVGERVNGVAVVAGRQLRPAVIARKVSCGNAPK